MHTNPADTSHEGVETFNCFLDRVLSTVTDTVYPELNLDVYHNADYKHPQLLDLLTHISLEGTFANSGAKTYRIQHGDRSLVVNDSRSQFANSLGNQLRAVEPAAISAQFDAVLDGIRVHAKRARLLTGAVDLAIDTHA